MGWRWRHWNSHGTTVRLEMVHFLVLDDDEAVARWVMELASRRPGVEASFHTSGSEALRAIMCDVRMPEMSGIEFTRTVAASDDPPTIVGMTSFDEDFSLIEMLRAGASGMVLKTGPQEHIVAEGSFRQNWRHDWENSSFQPLSHSADAYFLNGNRKYWAWLLLANRIHASRASYTSQCPP